MKKISIILIVIIVFNLIFSSVINATPIDAGRPETIQDVATPNNEETGNTLMESGEAPLTTEKIETDDSGNKKDEYGSGETTYRSASGTDSSGAATAGTIATVINVIPSIVNLAVSALVKADNTDTSVTKFTIQDLLYSKFDLFNINFFEGTTRENSEGVIEVINQKNTNITVKNSVAIWYNATQKIAIIISLLVLIYVGIRMAISTLAEDKAKYKTMFTNWIISFILIFLLHYIMIFAINISCGIISILPVEETNMETRILEGDNGEGLNKQISNAKGWNKVVLCILYWMITWQQIKFFVLYIKRMMSTAFLIIVAPLVTITYSIDKIGDGKAQAFDIWLKEFLVNVFIQPIHLIVYLIFITTAAEIATIAPIFAILFFMALSRAEKIIKNVLDLRDLSSIHSMK